MSHIAADETFLHNAIVLKDSECIICLQVSDMRAGWIGIKCDKCGAMYDVSEMWAGELAKRRREMLKMTRKELGNILGLKRTTIKRYEFVKCPKNYLDRVGEVIKIKKSK